MQKQFPLLLFFSSPRRRKFTIIALVVQLAVALVVLRRQKTEIKTNSDDEGVDMSTCQDRNMLLT